MSTNGTAPLILPPARSTKHSTTKTSPFVVNVSWSDWGHERAPVAAGYVVAEVVEEVVLVGTVEMASDDELVTVLPLYGRPNVELIA